METIKDQIKIIKIAPNLDFGNFLISEDLACSFACSQIFLGINFIDKDIPRGINIISSKYPKIGIKSGIKSIGLKAYERTMKINIFADKGVCLF